MSINTTWKVRCRNPNFFVWFLPGYHPFPMFLPLIWEDSYLSTAGATSPCKTWSSWKVIWEGEKGQPQGENTRKIQVEIQEFRKDDRKVKCFCCWLTSRFCFWIFVFIFFIEDFKLFKSPFAKSSPVFFRYTCSMFHANKAIVQNIFGQPLIVVFLITTLVTSLRPTSCYHMYPFVSSGSWSQESLADFCWFFFSYLYPPLTNIAPENGWLEDYFLFGKAYFQVRTVSFREGPSPSKVRLKFRIPVDFSIGHFFVRTTGGEKSPTFGFQMSDGSTKCYLPIDDES